MNEAKENSIKRINTSKGYALTLLLILLPLFLSLFLGFMFFAGIILEFTKSDSECYKNQFKIQLHAESQAQKLLSWNPKSTLYRNQKSKAQRKWNEAYFANDRMGMIQAEAKLSKILLHQITLDLKQKELLKDTHRIIQQNASNLQRNILFTKHPFINSLYPWISYNSQYKILEIPEFAFMVRDSELAPIYERSLDFSIRQKLALEWHIKFQVHPLLGNFKSLNFNFKRTCATTLIEKDNSWIPIIL